jgi:hypothetical protein
MSRKNEINRTKRARRRRLYEAHVKQLAVEKHYRAALRRILDAIGLPDLLRQLPEHEQEFLNKIRMRSVRRPCRIVVIDFGLTQCKSSLRPYNLPRASNQAP